jgi:cell division septation protein DedD
VDIIGYIRELLSGHDCVIIPDFGAFIGNYASARLDSATNTFFPPSKKISFNVNLTHNDGLLIGRISALSGLNYSDARDLVEEFVKDTRKKISRGERVSFSEIGSFTHNNEGNIQFEPDVHANYLLDSYGLDSFQFNPLEKYDVRKKILKQAEPVRNTSTRKILWRAAVIVPILGILVAIPFTTDIFRAKTQQTNLNPLASIEFENNRQAIDKTTVDSTLVLKPADAPVLTPATAEISQPAEVKTIPSENHAGYSIIAGSFKSRANANYLAKKLEADGYQPEIVDGPNGFLRVSVKTLPSLSEATETQENIARNYPGTWIAIVK